MVIEGSVLGGQEHVDKRSGDVLVGCQDPIFAVELFQKDAVAVVDFRFQAWFDIVKLFKRGEFRLIDAVGFVSKYAQKNKAEHNQRYDGIYQVALVRAVFAERYVHASTICTFADGQVKLKQAIVILTDITPERVFCFPFEGLCVIISAYKIVGCG